MDFDWEVEGWQGEVVQGALAILRGALAILRGALAALQVYYFDWKNNTDGKMVS